MRPGLAISLGSHALLIGIGLMSLGWTQQLDEPPVDSIAVDLVPMAAVANIRLGDLESTIVDTETPSAVDTEIPAELAQRTGNTQEDQPTPVDSETPSPAPTVSSAPEPVPEPEPEPDPIPAAAPPPEPAPTPEPVPEPAPAPTRVAALDPEPQPTPAPAPEPTPALPELAAPAMEPEPREVAPQPVTRTAALDQKRAEFKKQQDAEAKAAADQKARQEADAKKAAEEKSRQEADAKAKAADDKKRKDAEEKKRKDAEAKRIADARAAEQRQAKAADDISNIINNETSRGSVSGEGGQKTLGREDGRSATLSQSQLQGLGAAMRVCFSPPMGALEEGAKATLLITFNADGSVATADIRSVSGATLGGTTGQAAIRAARNCGPYSLVAENYQQLREVEVLFDPALQY